MPQVERDAHPRPDFMRDTFESLNGEWQFAYDDNDVGLKEGWHRTGKALPLSIQVPFCYQCEAGGLGGDEIHPILWYRRGFTVPDEMRGRRILLRFGAVDYQCAVYVNGERVGEHTGGYLPFALDITFALRDGENDLCLRVADLPDVSQPRGKQYWKRGVMGCWYTPVSGIWQSVYLEAVGSVAITRLHVTPDIDRRMATVDVSLDAMPGEELLLQLKVQPMPVWSDKTDDADDTDDTDDNDEASPSVEEIAAIQFIATSISLREASFPLDMRQSSDIHGLRLWHPDSPALYSLTATLSQVRYDEQEGQSVQVLDCVQTYFGMRKIEVKDGHVLLNNSPLYQRLVLDQGYWPDTLLTPPDAEALKTDIKWMKAFGYNGCRKHQKIEDPRFYYWADRMGLLVWGELPATYVFTDDSVNALTETMKGFIDRDFNHPCIATWVPINESWGVEGIYTQPKQQSLARALYHICKAADGTRLVSSNDGWEQVETDIFALHDYEPDGACLSIQIGDRARLNETGCIPQMAWAQGEQPKGGEAFLLTEYGGIAFDNIGAQGQIGGMQTWGYGDKEHSEEAFLARYAAIQEAVLGVPFCRGYCYTQLTDVQQEVNGLLTPDRKPKVDPAKFAMLTRNPRGRVD